MQSWERRRRKKFTFSQLFSRPISLSCYQIGRLSTLVFFHSAILSCHCVVSALDDVDNLRSHFVCRPLGVYPKRLIDNCSWNGKTFFFLISVDSVSFFLQAQAKLLQREEWKKFPSPSLRLSECHSLLLAFSCGICDDRNWIYSTLLLLLVPTRIRAAAEERKKLK